MLRHLFISAGHNYFGHSGKPAGTFSVAARPRIECVAGRGIRGDRFFDFKPDYKGQITFVSWENYLRLWDELGIPAEARDPAATRRNVITEGMELDQLIEKEFEIQGVRFLGTEECRPCYWMNGAIHPDAEAWMRGRGGLRAKILSDGWLKLAPRGSNKWIFSALLAGGMSTRLGQDKASLEVGGMPLWRRQVDLLRSIGGPVAVSAPERPPWLAVGQSFVQDHPAAHGPMAGLLASLEWAAERGGSHVLALAVDMPRMSPQIVQKLAGACRPGEGVIPASGSLFEPLCAVYPVAAIPVLLEFARDGHWKLQDVVRNLIARGLLMSQSLSVEESSLFFNLDSPDDLAALGTL